MTMNIEQIRAEAAAKRQQALTARIEQAEIAMLTNDKIQAGLTEQDFIDSQINKLKNYVETLRDYYTLVPTVNSKGATRKPPTTRLFNQGEALDLLAQLCSLMQYAPKAHELLVKAVVPTVSTTLVEKFLNSIGRATYLGRDGVIVEEIQPDFNGLQSSAQLLLIQLGVLLTTDEMSEVKLAESFTKARNTAIGDLAKQKQMADEEETKALFVMED